MTQEKDTRKKRPARRMKSSVALSLFGVPGPSRAAPPLVNRLEAAIGQAVREFRKAAGLGVVELAKLARLSAGMLSRIENGTISPSLATLQSLARALKV